MSRLVKKKKVTSEGSEGRVKIMTAASGLFVLSILCVFPLVYHDFYFDILQTKYKYYYINAIVLIGITVTVAIINFVKTYESYGIDDIKNLFRKRKERNYFLVPKISLLCFLIIAVISTLQSDYIYEAFWGNEGRFTGLFLLLLYGLSFFIVSRYFVFKRWYLDAFLITGMLVCLFGIVQYFGIDVLGFKETMQEVQRSMFASTLGNINTYTAYIALVIGVASALFIISEDRYGTIWYYVCMVISFFAIVTGQSDNAYLALGALFGFLPFCAFKKRRGIRRYILMLATFFTVIQVVDYANFIWSDRVLGVDGLFNVLVNYDNLLGLVIVLWTICACWYYIDKRRHKDGSDEVNKRVRITWGVLLALGVIVISYMLLDANFGGNPDKYGVLSRYLVINDDWGTRRGYVWRIGMEYYREFPLLQKLFGYGPDTFGILTTKYNLDEMVSLYGEVFDSAHNEYLQYLITIGLLGAISYLTLLISSVVLMVKRAAEKPYMLALMFAVLCYGVQAFVNINLPIATPVMWTLLMIGVSGKYED